LSQQFFISPSFLGEKGADSMCHHRKIIYVLDALATLERTQLMPQVQVLALPGGIRLELITYFGTNQDIHTNPSDSGIFRHIAFEVDDVRDVEKWMLENAIEVTLSITRVPKLGVYAILVKDPNGVELEFIQKL
jgi:catechol-2,3-dioxygenase